jgi:glutathione S-transferase
MANLRLIFGNKNYSSWSLRPWVFLRYYDIPFQEERIPLFSETAKQVLAKHYSNGKVPILMHGDLEIWDSLAILEFISEQYLDGRGWPEGLEARAVARSISAEMHASFMAIRNEMPMNCRKHFPQFTYSEHAKKDIQRIVSLWEMCRNQFGGDGQWLFGQYSIADAMFAPVALRFHGYDVPLEGAAAAYVNNVLQLPCIQEWISAGKAETEVIPEDEV